MKDMIYRDDAIRVASGYCHPANVAKELAKLPSAEPEIIRCKDCKWRYETYHNNRRLMVCDFMDFRMNDDDFCSRAERRVEHETD